MNEYPRPTGPQLDVSDLQPADVLLSRGRSRVSDMIVAADRGSYSHAALWSGGGIIEATLDGGVSEAPAAGYRDVYRYRSTLAGQLDLPPDVARRVVAVARDQVGKAYDSSELYLLGLAFARHERPSRSLASSVTDLLGGATATKLQSWLQQVYKRSAPRICTELVALAYYSAASAPTYALRLLPVAGRPASGAAAPAAAPASLVAPQPQSVEPELDALDAEVISLQRRIRQLGQASKAGSAVAGPPQANAVGLMYGHLALLADSGTPVDIVTPADLQFSPSLRFIGTLRA